MAYLRRSYRTTRPADGWSSSATWVPTSSARVASCNWPRWSFSLSAPATRARELSSGCSSRGRCTGRFPEQLLPLAARPDEDRASAGQVASAFDDLATEDRVWLLLGAPALAPDGHRRVLSSRISRWDSLGATSSVRVGDSSARLQMPPAPVAIAALRGEGLAGPARGPTVGR